MKPAWTGAPSLARLRNTNLSYFVSRDIGASQAPFNAWNTLTGIETLSLRMDRHCSNAQQVAEFLRSARSRIPAGRLGEADQSRNAPYDSAAAVVNGRQADPRFHHLASQPGRHRENGPDLWVGVVVRHGRNPSAR